MATPLGCRTLPDMLQAGALRPQRHPKDALKREDNVPPGDSNISIRVERANFLKSDLPRNIIEKQRQERLRQDVKGVVQRRRRRRQTFHDLIIHISERDRTSHPALLSENRRATRSRQYDMNVVHNTTTKTERYVLVFPQKARQIILRV